MTDLLLMLCLLSIVELSSATKQTEPLKTFTPGDTVRVECLVSETYNNYYSWLKMTIGEAPEVILSMYSNSDQVNSYGEFKNSSRFTAERTGSRFILTISDMCVSDEGMYYCFTRDYETYTFGNGVFLMHREGDIRSQHLLQQPMFESIQPGDSVTLNCTIHTETCAGEHSVYWFRHGTGESHPGILYTHKDRSGQCGKSPEAGSPTQSCVYNLPKRNLSLSDAGTYYCAVASCGEILFGNGTVVDITDMEMDPRILALVLSNIFSLAVIILLIYVRVKKSLVKGEIKQSHDSIKSGKEKDEGEMNYATVHIPARKAQKGATRTHSGKEVESVVVYAGVREWN